MDKTNSPKGLHAWTVKVGARGQIIIPKQARDIFNINPGDTIILLGDEKRGIAIDTSVDFATMHARLFSDGIDHTKKDEGEA